MSRRSRATRRKARSSEAPAREAPSAEKPTAGPSLTLESAPPPSGPVDELAELDAGWDDPS